MPYIEPTASTFSIRYPEFACVDDALIQMILNDAISSVGDCWLEKDRAKAQMLLAAHTLSLEGEPQRSLAIENGGAVNNQSVGAIIEMQDRDVRVKFSDKQEQVAENSTLGAIGQGYMQTQYGKEYYLLLRRNAPSMMVV